MTVKKWKINVPERFEVTDREYKINDKPYQRVTSTLGIIAKHRLMNWMGQVGHVKANQILQTRQAIGTHVHKLIELTLQDKDFNLGTYELEIQEGMCKFFEFRVAASLKPDGLEQRLWSKKHRYAGTADYVGYYETPVEFLVSKTVNHKRVKIPKFENGGYVIGDWKTAKDIYPQYWLQIAAYAMAFYELTGIKVDGGFILRIRDGTLKVKEMTWDELVVEFEAYLHALKLYEWFYKIKR
jgi:hypothetical protein